MASSLDSMFKYMDYNKISNDRKPSIYVNHETVLQFRCVKETAMATPPPW